MFKLFRRKPKDDEAPPAAAPTDSVVAVAPPPADTAPTAVARSESPPASPPAAGPASLPVAVSEPAAQPMDEAEIGEQTALAVERTRRTWFRRITGVFERSTIDDELWDELEELLIAADTGIETTDVILNRVRERVREDGLKRPSEVRDALKDELEDILLAVDEVGGLWSNAEDRPAVSTGVILVVGVNGVGKTTSIAKLAALFKRDGERVVLAAADTFRAAAIDQLKMWGDRIGVDVIAGRPGSDPGAVVYDAMEAAKARQSDILIVDTAGRLHTKHNLMQELSKIRKVLQGRDPTAPHEVLLVVDATTGQNGLIQARAFADAAEITAICLTKLDGTAKGGIVFSICDQMGIPVRFIGTGERAEDLAPFDPRQFVEALFAE